MLEDNAKEYELVGEFSRFFVSTSSEYPNNQKPRLIFKPKVLTECFSRESRLRKTGDVILQKSK